MWAGIDVGGRRKGFHCALIVGDEVRALFHSQAAGELVEWLRVQQPRLVAVDSPVSTAPDGLSSREGERLLVRARVCSIRYTPTRAEVDRNDYYEWIRNGLELYAALAAAEIPAIECFPTASWSRLAGPRGKERRAAWTRRALAALDLGGIPPRLNQDYRDAIGAAMTARLHDEGATEAFGEIVVPSAARAKSP
jgi:predicted nuclease with RNAse H fold